MSGKPRKVLLTGKHGFIGSHLAQFLERLNYKVIPGDREGNVPEPVDYVIDLAAYGNMSSQLDKTRIWEVNVTRLRRLFENAGKYKYKGFIVTSSSSVSLPVQTEYSLSKREAETVATLYYHFYGKPVSIIRPYTVYGPGDNEDHLIPKVFDSCLNGTPIELDPEATHDYIYVDDLVKAYFDIMHNRKHQGEVFEIGRGRPITNAEVVVLIESITQSRAYITGFKRFRKYDIDSWASADVWGDTPLASGLFKIYADLKLRVKKTNTLN